MKIILLHGLYMHGIAMIPLCNRLKEAGHEVLNLSYNTISPDTPSLFGEMDDFIDGDEAAIVAHSMGGVITRAYMEADSDMSHCVKTVITLGTPHQGSKIAEYLKEIGIGDWMFQSASEYLMPKNTPSWPKGAALYSIAGDMPIGPARVLLDAKQSEASDGTVLLKETEINGMTSHETFPLTHTALIYAKRVSNRILDILA
ncbi:cob(I)alamin adenolsyltransferase [Enterovibrio norvegicus]|uniref:PGAP1-like alpha/beta domain-containing protein n=1 Tax=Enterovibrio norvegicus TaxID=188144 RepID=UPI000315DF92|nr:alpha/beta hydrolase [Enterovibrio norvegicus]MCC4797137.1 alpha/beta hydrolase [Enterovibrio norvegicus]OEE50238.1 cob(I)alamin adenolsyltransferase [Enterovibrio norvegicus]PMH64009.1 cob(I)alamin adenolsyltransferase [Enterovibrio norvegicus]PMI31364.1 cob(I)alamin adenolsyltransferase [Enterovibrio norvegicus]PMI35274.1 cob(I)alamin adenolsyltransferase [Enterovibrio norvegicus]